MNSEYERNWDLYRALLTELQYTHTRWIDNVRVILTFNSILLPGIVAIFLLLAKTDITQEARQAAPWILTLLSCVGIIVTAVGAAFVARLSAIGRLQYNQIRHLERSFGSEVSLRPITEGWLFIAGDSDGLLACREDALEGVRNLTLGKLPGHFGYMLISCVFGFSYVLLMAFVMWTL